jgi:hypothetical protein
MKRIKAVKVGDMYKVRYFNTVEEASISITGKRKGIHKISTALNKRRYWENVFEWRWIYTS